MNHTHPNRWKCADSVRFKCGRDERQFLPNLNLDAGAFKISVSVYSVFTYVYADLNLQTLNGRND